MKYQPLVSVLTTARNAQDYIGQAIESILSQSFKNFEFLIIDDASSDRTWEIILTYQKKDERIKAFKNNNQEGISKNRNKLVLMASGKYIAWQDADDISLPARIEKQVEFMDANPLVGICGGWLDFFNGKKSNGIRKYPASDEILRKNIFRFSPVAQPASIIKKKALLESGKYNEDLVVAEDLDMSFCIGQRYKFANIQEVILRYRQSDSSITKRKLRQLELNTLKIRFNFFKDKNYHFSLVDFGCNIGQFLTLYLMPVKFRICLFNFFRNNKKNVG